MSDGGQFAPETSARAVLGRVTDPMFALDEAAALAFCNPAAAELFSTADPVSLGDPVRDHLRDRFGPAFSAQLRDAAETGVSASFRAYDTVSKRWVRAAAHPSAGRLTVTVSPVPDDDAARLAEAADAAIDGIAILNPDEEYVYMNQAHAAVFDFEPDELLGDTWRRLYGPAEQARIEREAFPRLRRDGAWRGETTGRRRDGSVVRQDVSLSLLDDGSLVCTNKDITERYRREQELERQRTRIRALFDNSPDGIIVHDAEGAVLDANETERRALGVDRAALLSMNVADFEVGHTAAELEAMWREMDDGETLKIEGVHRRASGEEFPVEVWVNKLAVAGNEQYIALSRDITDQKRREDELRRTREFIERAQASADIGGWEVDLATDSLRWTDEVYRIHDLPLDADVTLTDGFDFYHPEDAPRVADAFDRLVEGGEPYDLELRIVTADDRVRWVRTVGEPRVGTADEVTTAVGVFQDITERKRRERELDQLRERLDLAVTGANLGVWDWDMTTDEVTFNDRWATMLGLSPDEIDPHLDAWETRVHPADLPRVEAQLEAHVAGETEMYDCEHRMRTAAGEWTWIRDAGKIVEYDAEGAPKRAVGIHLDIDAQKRQEAALERARNELRQVIDLVPDPIFAKDADGRYLLANEATADAYGLTVAETEGTLESEIIPDGDQSVHFRADDKQVLDSDEPVEIPEEKLTTADGETRLLQTTKIPYTVAGTDQNAVLGYARDVTPLRQYESQLEEQRDSLTVLNQIVRHDIRNALQVITGSAELLADRLDGEETRLIDAIQLSAAEAIEITTSAREVTDLLVRTEPDLSPVPLTPVLTQQIEAVRSGDRPVRVVRAGESDERPVLADDMLDSVFRNLLGNAVAHTDADVPSIRVATTALSDWIRVSVADNGPGVPDAEKEAIFEEGICGLDSDGTGLGLYLVRTLVERYDGAVWVDDAEEGGARFTVELPRADAEEPATDD